MIDWALISSSVLCSAVSFYLGMAFVRRSPREYLQDAMRVRQVDESACGDDLDGVCFPGARMFAARKGDAHDYLYFHELAHQALADRGLQNLQEAPEEAEAAADVIAWLLCRRTGAGDAMNFSSSVSQSPGDVLLSLQEIATAFQVADHLFEVLCDGGLEPPQTKPPQPTRRSQQNV